MLLIALLEPKVRQLAMAGGGLSALLAALTTLTYFTQPRRPNLDLLIRDTLASSNLRVPGRWRDPDLWPAESEADQ